MRVYPAAACRRATAFERMTNSAAIECWPNAALETGAILFETALGDFLDASVERSSRKFSAALPIA